MSDYIIRTATTSREAALAQDLDNRSWEGGFQKYGQVFRHDRDSLIVAVPSFMPVDNLSNFFGYVGTELVSTDDFYTLSRSPWDHDLYGEGSVRWINGLAVNEDIEGKRVARGLLEELVRMAGKDSEITSLAVLGRGYDPGGNHAHPTLGRNLVKFWETFEFAVLEEFYNPHWHNGNSEVQESAVILVRNL